MQPVKATLGAETRETGPLTKSFSELVQRLRSLFPAIAHTSFKIMYKDPDGDLISVTTEEDYQIACDSLQNSLEFIIKPDGEISPSGLDIEKTSTVASTYVVVGAKQEEEKKSQPTVAEVCAPSKEDATGTVIKEEGEPCFACGGSKTNGKGLPCKKCAGTGRLAGPLLALKKHFEKLIDARVAQAVQTEFERQSSILAQSRRLCDLVESVAHSRITEKEGLTCSVCKGRISSGEAVYSCMLCPGLCVCEICEESFEHPHALVKSRAAGERQELNMKVIQENAVGMHLAAGTKVMKIWDVLNTGKSAWPKGTELVWHSGQVIKPATASAISSVGPGQRWKVAAEFPVPYVPGEYEVGFRLLAGGRKFGDVLKLKMKVEEPKRGAVDPEARIVMELDRLKKTMVITKSDEEKVFNIMTMNEEWSAEKVMGALTKAGGNANKAIELLFP